MTEPKPPFYFTPLEDFYSHEFKSVYAKGLNYTVRVGNEKLHEHVKTWIEAGQVRVITDKELAARSRASGAGAVTGAPRKKSWLSRILRR